MSDWFDSYNDDDEKEEEEYQCDFEDEQGNAALAPCVEDIDRTRLPKKIMKTTSLHLQFFCVIIMKVGCNIRELSNREMNAGQRAIKMFRGVEQGLRDRTAFPLPDGVAASQMLKHSYFNLANGGEAAFAQYCVGMVPAMELTKDMIRHGDAIYTNKFLETRCKIRLTAQPKFKDILTSFQPNARSGHSADVADYLKRANEELHKFLFHQHALEPTIDSVSKQPKHYKDQEYNPSWQQNWWLFWCTECSPSGKRSSSATMEALEESLGPAMEATRSDNISTTPSASNLSFPTSEKQKQHLSRRDIERKNKLERTTKMDSGCDHSWLPHPCALNGVPAVFCRKCTLMKACIIQDTPSPSYENDQLLTPSSPSSQSKSVVLSHPSSQNDQSGGAATYSVPKELFKDQQESSHGNAQSNQSVNASEQTLFHEYYRALESLSKTVWNVNIERKARSTLCAPCLSLFNTILQETRTERGKGIFAKTFIPKNQVVALYRGAHNILSPLFCGFS